MDSFAEPLDEADLADKLTKLKSGDIDKQINAIQYLGIRLEASAKHSLPPSTPDALVLVVPPLLSSHSNLLYTSVLSNYLPFLLPLLPAEKIGLAVKVFVTGSSGLWDKVADGKERVHKPAEECLIILGKLVFRPSTRPDGSSLASSTLSTHNSNSQALQAQDNFLTSLLDHLAPTRAPRIKLGALRILREIKSSQDTGKALGLKSVLPVLVELLEDGDGGVREAVRETIASLLSPSTVSLVARTELKKLMLAKSLKSTLIDGIIRGIEIASTAEAPGREASASSTGITRMDGSEERDDDDEIERNGGVGTVGPNGGRSVSGPGQHRSNQGLNGASIVPNGGTSMLSNSEQVAKPTVGGSEAKAVYIITEQELEREFEALSALFQGKETEDNWKAREKAIHRARGMLVAGVHDEFRLPFMACLRAEFLNNSIKALTSLRSTMSIATSDLYIELARALGPAFDPLLDTVLTPLAKMSTLNKKIIANKSQEALSALITHTSCAPKTFFPHLQAGASDKVIQARIYFAGHLKLYLEIHGRSDKSAIEHAPNGGLSIITDCLKRNLTDPNPDVKVIARQTYWVFRSEWPKEGVQLLDQLDENARKAVEKAGASDGATSRSVSANVSKSAEQAPASRKLSGIIAAALKKARLEAASREPESEPELSEGNGNSLPGSPRTRTMEMIDPRVTPTRIPLPPTPSPKPLQSMATPSPGSNLFYSGMPSPRGQLLDLIDTPVRQPAMVSNGAARRQSAGLPLNVISATLRARNAVDPTTHGHPAFPRRTTNRNKAEAPPSKPFKAIKAMMIRGPPSSLFAGLGTRSDCKFWLDRKDDYIHGEPGPVTNDDEAFLTDLTDELDADTLEQLGDLSCEAPNEGSAATFPLSRQIIRAVREVRVEGSESHYRPQWSHVCDILTEWLSKESTAESADTGLFLLWDLAIRHSSAVQGKEEHMLSACLHLSQRGDFQTRQGSVALMAFLAEMTAAPAALAGAVYKLCRTVHGSRREKSLAEQHKAMELTMIEASILVLRMEASDVREVVEHSRDLIMQGMSSPAIAVREATSTFLVAAHRILDDQDGLLGTGDSPIAPQDGTAEGESDGAGQPFVLLPDLSPEQRSLLIYQFKAHATVSSGVGQDGPDTDQEPGSGSVTGSFGLNGSEVSVTEPSAESYASAREKAWAETF